jgi:hypothetical protein
MHEFSSPISVGTLRRVGGGLGSGGTGGSWELRVVNGAGEVAVWSAGVARL